MCENKSVWRETELPRYKSLSADTKCDVLIVGGGIAGLLLAYYLEQNGVNYILVEKERICSGVTYNTTAKITLQHGLIYDKLISDCGLDTAKGYYSANKKAVEEYFKLCKNIDCDFEIKNNFVYSKDDRGKIENEFKALERIGEKAVLKSSLPLPFEIAGAVGVENQGQFNPLKFLSHIVKGLNIYEETKVKEFLGNTAITNKGEIKAENIVIATHFPIINKHGNFFLKLYQHRSYVLALENAPRLDGMYVDESDNGLSFRNYGDVLLFGGGGHRTGKKGGGYRELRQLAGKYFKGAKERYSFATQDCISLDKMPYIGRYSKNTHNLFVATGFNKWGMTSSMVAANMLCQMLLGKKNEFEEVFNPSRSILKPQLFLNGIETTANLLRPTTPRCPHLGCALKWNGQEHSWDCSCHGSRFSNKGKLLNGPATDDINFEK